MFSDGLVGISVLGTYGEGGGGDIESPRVYWSVSLGFLFKKKCSSHETQV